MAVEDVARRFRHAGLRVTAPRLAVLDVLAEHSHSTADAVARLVRTKHVHSYSKDGAMRIDNVTDPVYAPNSVGGPKADPVAATYAGLYALDGEMTRSAYTLHAEDDDYGQANTLLNKVLTEEQRERLVETVAGAAAGVKSEDIRERVYQYWKNIDKAVGDRIEAAIKAKLAQGGSEKGGARFD